VRPAISDRGVPGRPERSCSERPGHTALQSGASLLFGTLSMRALYGVFAILERQTGISHPGLRAGVYRMRDDFAAPLPRDVLIQGNATRLTAHIMDHRRGRATGSAPLRHLAKGYRSQMPPGGRPATNRWPCPANPLAEEMAFPPKYHHKPTSYKTKESGFTALQCWCQGPGTIR
jgi:hypothetical protein